MELRLQPELAELIKQDVPRSPYHTVDEFVEHAVSLLHEQEAWLAENPEIAALFWATTARATGRKIGEAAGTIDRHGVLRLRSASASLRSG